MDRGRPLCIVEVLGNGDDCVVIGLIFRIWKVLLRSRLSLENGEAVPHTFKSRNTSVSASIGVTEILRSRMSFFTYRQASQNED